MSLLKAFYVCVAGSIGLATDFGRLVKGNRTKGIRIQNARESICVSRWKAVLQKIPGCFAYKEA